MTQRFAESELILNEDGSIYHIHISPEILCKNIILVGDPERVSMISQHFDRIDFQSENREIIVHKGQYKAKDLMVLSTGMGTDNIDIILNELDALANIDFHTRRPKKQLQSLNIIRIGTSGALQKETPIGSVILSEEAIGLDGMIWAYDTQNVRNTAYEKALNTQIPYYSKGSEPYVVNASQELLQKIYQDGFFLGSTATCNGFYGPQGRVLRLNLSNPNWIDALQKFEFQGKKITNMEMETAGIYALSLLLGHHALSVNLILANRAKGEFLTDYKNTMNQLIVKVLDAL